MVINRNILINQKVEEVNLSKNLINLRVLELLQETCEKIKLKIANEKIPKQLKTKHKYRHSQEKKQNVQEELGKA